jgi:hypothetical protein
MRGGWVILLVVLGLVLLIPQQVNAACIAIDGACTSTENEYTCPQDCSKSVTDAYGDGSCDTASPYNEGCDSPASDCGACINSYCNLGSYPPISCAAGLSCCGGTCTTTFSGEVWTSDACDGNNDGQINSGDSGWFFKTISNNGCAVNECRYKFCSSCPATNGCYRSSGTCTETSGCGWTQMNDGAECVIAAFGSLGKCVSGTCTPLCQSNNVPGICTTGANANTSTLIGTYPNIYCPTTPPGTACYSCKDGYKAVNNQCIIDCSNQCTLGAKQCSGSNLQECKTTSTCNTYQTIQSCTAGCNSTTLACKPNLHPEDHHPSLRHEPPLHRHHGGPGIGSRFLPGGMRLHGHPWSSWPSAWSTWLRTKYPGLSSGRISSRKA